MDGKAVTDTWNKPLGPGARMKPGTNKDCAAAKMATSPGARGETGTTVAKRATMDQQVVKFVPEKVENLLKTVLDAYLHKVKYDPARCSKLAQDMCSVIKSKTKEFNFEGYKLVVQVYVGQDSDQSIQMASRCLWNAEVDAFAAATYRNKSLYGIALVYGLRLG